MTVYGGRDRGDGVILDGFFITCAKCGWHSKVKIWLACHRDCIIFDCGHCDNRYVFPEMFMESRLT